MEPAMGPAMEPARSDGPPTPTGGQGAVEIEPQAVEALTPNIRAQEKKSGLVGRLLPVLLLAATVAGGLYYSGIIGGGGAKDPDGPHGAGKNPTSVPPASVEPDIAPVGNPGDPGDTDSPGEPEQGAGSGMHVEDDAQKDEQPTASDEGSATDDSSEIEASDSDSTEEPVIVKPQQEEQLKEGFDLVDQIDSYASSVLVLLEMILAFMSFNVWLVDLDNPTLPPRLVYPKGFNQERRVAYMPKEGTMVYRIVDWYRSRSYRHLLQLCVIAALCLGTWQCWFLLPVKMRNLFWAKVNAAVGRYF